MKKLYIYTNYKMCKCLCPVLKFLVFLTTRLEYHSKLASTGIHGVELDEKQSLFSWSYHFWFLKRSQTILAIKFEIITCVLYKMVSIFSTKVIRTTGDSFGWIGLIFPLSSTAYVTVYLIPIFSAAVGYIMIFVLLTIKFTGLEEVSWEFHKF